ncbi:YopX family protein [Streptococcus pluranimalium]|uniref:YopX family protein n=1 Tax=Streptococcus pluranimalium TaxID=82348 RepID=UPI004046A75A
MITKYRVWDTVKKAMSEVQAIVYTEKKIYPIYYKVVRRYVPFSEAVLMQSTGQKDCHNSDIFDADILLEPWTGHVVGRVFYSLGDLAWKVLLVGGGEEFLSDCLDLQVCGNIHEHPHLLEGLGDG